MGFRHPEGLGTYPLYIREDYYTWEIGGRAMDKIKAFEAKVSYFPKCHFWLCCLFIIAYRVLCNIGHF